MKLKTLSILIGSFFWASNVSANTIVQCGKTAESLAFILDVSGSMMERVADVKKEAEYSISENNSEEITRMALVKSFLRKTVNAVEQKTKMSSALYTVAPYTELIPIANRSANDFSNSLSAIPDTLEVFGRSTWLGKRAQQQFNKALSKPEAIVLITDGHFEALNSEMSPVDNLKSFYNANPNTCIHIVSVAYRNEERAGIEALSGINDCSSVTHIEDLLNKSQAFDEFISSVYYRDCVMEINGVNFDFDKAVLTTAETAKLLEAVNVLMAQPQRDRIIIRGWTDWTGSDAYNLKLSLKRAEAVRDYFIEQGLDAESIAVEGMGKSFKYSNKTGDGRWMNRRVEIHYGSTLKSKDAITRH